jgi:hypothetical protein
MIFGPSPKAETVPRYIYENKEEGFYNFYIKIIKIFISYQIGSQNFFK